MLPASLRMRVGTDFEAAVRRGRRAGSSRVVVHTSTSAVADGPRVGFVVARSVGGSVVRHRVARRLRETVRPHLSQLDADRLVVVRAQPASSSAAFQDLADDVSRLFVRLGLVPGPGGGGS